eukprot:scaffold89832_cov60-Phaeocystis_antarctica.AAC.4
MAAASAHGWCASRARPSLDLYKPVTSFFCARSSSPESPLFSCLRGDGNAGHLPAWSMPPAYAPLVLCVALACSVAAFSAACFAAGVGPCTCRVYLS